MNYEIYRDYITFTYDEELERLGEYLFSIHSNTDYSDDKPWTVNPPSIISKEKAEELLKDRDIEADMKVIKGESGCIQEDLYAELRELIVYF